MNEVFSKGIEELRNKLIDTSRRNKLINYKRPSKLRNLKIIDESAEFIFEHLVKNEGKFRFDSIPEPDIDGKEIDELKKKKNVLQKQLESNQLPKGSDRLHVSRSIESLKTQIDDMQRQALLTPEERAKELGFNISGELPNIDLHNGDVDEKHIDDTLQTLHYPNEMEKILTNIERNARSIIEETGSNMLYLVLGVLQWQEANHSDHENKSPLITIPVVLTKTKKSTKYEFTMEFTGEGLETNRSLAEKLLFEFGIVLPELSEEVSFREYLEQLNAAISEKHKWRIKQEIALDFLHFGKILMYQDLKEENWEEGLIDNPVLNDIFIGKEVQSDATFAPEYDIDTNEIANRLPLVMDADSSQHSAIVDVLQNKNVIIEGPPGTGKSQTISNTIAALLAEGKSVLFVSEKLAALEVVQKRLEHIGLGDFCLELHSQKSKKTQILESIQKRVDTRYEDIQILQQTIQDIEHKKKQLKDYLDAIHKLFGNIEQSIFSIFWTTEIYSDGASYQKLDVPSAKDYTRFKLNNVLDELEKFRQFHESYDFDTFYWRGLDLYKLDFIDIDDFLSLLGQLKGFYLELQRLTAQLPFKLEHELDEIEKIVTFIEQLSIPEAFDASVLKHLQHHHVDFQQFVHEYDETRNIIEKLGESLQEYATFTNHNNEILTQLKIIEETIKKLSLELNLPKNFDITYIQSLLVAIHQLAKIDEKQYLSLSERFGTSNFEILIVEAEAAFQKVHDLGAKADRHSHVSSIDAMLLDDIIRIETIIEAKKNSFFNFFSGEYRKTLKEFEALEKDALPKEKTEWTTILGDIKTYAHHRQEFNNSSKYEAFFGKLFEGMATDWGSIKTLSDWSKQLRTNARNLELINFILSADASKYHQLMAIRNDLEDALSQLEFNLKATNKIYDHKFVQKLFRSFEEINILELKDRLEELNDNMESIHASMYKGFEIDAPESFVDNVMASISRADFQELEYQINKADSEANDLVYRFNNLSKQYKTSSTFLNKLNTDHNLSLSLTANDRTKIIDTTEVYEAISKTPVMDAIKTLLLENFETKILLDEIGSTHKRLLSVQQELGKYGMINRNFYGKEPVTISMCIDKLDHAPENKGILSIWSDFRKISHSVIDMGLENLVKGVEAKQIPLDMLDRVFLYNFYNTLVREIFRENPLLVNFSRLSHEQIIRTYRELDQQLIIQNRKKVAYLSAQRKVPMGYRSNRKSELTELSLIDNELGKKKRHIPIRQLVRRAPNALKGLKPCFMMSPLSVAQYLPPNDIIFDVLVVDEASQLRPEEALGSVARAHQVVIVGDPKQLPPTSFFDSIEKATEDETVASESESILDICLNLYKPIRQLRWHYRSQHESLIDFSNQQFYEGNLLVFPSPTGISSDELGVKYHYIKNSVYQNRRNKTEAKIIIDHLEQQMKRYPERSIGIGTFNSDQRDLIQDMVDEQEKRSPVMTNYIAEWRKKSEPFFVKNLENLQGDERDVIMISTTYGKDKDTGKVYQRFGPINSDTGWRRLNVMFTRAKQKMEVFTSMGNDDIKVTESSSRGVRALKAFLYFLETATLTKAPTITDRGFDSEFEESVYKILSDSGYNIVPQVGVAGYFIDLAVVSEKNSNDFVLAIECDGASYHSSKSARDRDRLKQEVLERLGWNIYRIWSIDWYKNREQEISKLIEAVRKAQAEYKGKEVSPFAQEIKVEEVEQIDDDINVEIEKEENKHHHEDEELNQNTYTQSYLPDEKIKEILIELRDTKIAEEFEIDKRCILSDMMIELFVEHKPINMDEFRSAIPLRYRNEQVINIEQMKYMPEIFEILELADE